MTMSIRDINNEIREIVLGTINKVNEYRRMRIGISDIAKCLRYSYFAHINPHKVTDKTIIGIENHEIFVSVFSEILENRGYICEREVRIPGEIGARVDLYCIDGNAELHVYEFKFTGIPYKSNPYFQWYLRQLKYYMALVIRHEMKSRVYGHLVMVSHDLSAHDIWSEVMNREDSEKYIREIEERAEILRRAKEGGPAPPPEKGPYCNSCPFRQACFNERLL